MKVQTIIATKGDQVVTMPPDATIAAAVRVLKAEGIGALVVSEDGVRVQGILSERDVVRGLDSHGAELMAMKVAELMTTSVKTCSPEDNIQEVMAEMTQGRFRHLPVVANGRLGGMISIGDLVKSRLDELESEAGELRDYIGGLG